EQERASQSARDRRLPWPQVKVARAENALIRLSRDIWTTKAPGRDALSPLEGTRTLAAVVECRVTSRDGLLAGVIDRVEQAGERTRIVDFKTITQLSDDAVLGYVRQVKLYAALWHDAHGSWPGEARVVYPLLQQETVVAIDP